MQEEIKEIRVPKLTEPINFGLHVGGVLPNSVLIDLSSGDLSACVCVLTFVKEFAELNGIELNRHARHAVKTVLPTLEKCLKDCTRDAPAGRIYCFDAATKRAARRLTDLTAGDKMG